MPMTTVRKNSLHRAMSAERTVENYELQLQAQIARSSYLQSRLSSTMDTVDDLRIRHRREIAAEKDAQERLKAKMDRLIEYTAKVEGERDEYRECLAAVIEKVELTHDFSAWPHGRLSLLEPVEPVAVDSVDVGAAQKCTSQTHQSPDYYRTTIALLRAELERERASHSRTHDTAEVEILTLHAQLARREAELEACVAHSGVDHRTLLAQSGELKRKEFSVARGRSTLRKKVTRARAQHIQASTLTTEQVSRLLDLTTAKNMRLEAENQRITARLAKTRTESATSAISSTDMPAGPAVVKEQSLSSDDPHPGYLDEDNDTMVNPMPADAERAEPVTPKSPDLHPIVALDMPSPFAMTPQRPISPSTPVSPSTKKLSKDTSASQHQTPTSTEDEPSTAQQVEEQIQRLAQEIDAFKVQRNVMSGFIVREREGHIADQHLQPEQIQNMQSNTHQKAHDQTTDWEQCPAVRALRSELEQTKQNASRRESELMTEIIALRALIECDRSAPPPNSLPFISAEVLAASSPRRGGPNLEHDEDDDGGEKSMDLDSPLWPLFALFDSTPALIDSDAPVVSEDVDTSLIPLPRSPTEDDSDSELISPLSRASALQDRPPTPFSIIPEPQRDDDRSVGEYGPTRARSKE